ncbi:MAG: DegT/DnrJ/EryC1/StrS family aminotransferase [Pseudomonadales bacterium]
MRSSPLIFGAPDLAEAEVQAVADVLRSGWLGTGPKVAAFESQFARYQQASHAVALNSCTAALHLSMLAAGVSAGDEVITTPLTFCATANAIIHAGARPVLVDVDPLTMNIDPRLIAAAITPRTRALLPVHFAGRPCAMDEIMAVARDNGLKVIEDCAHAIESRYRGAAAGTIGDMGCFSFYVTKNVVTGEGGMVITDDREAAERIKVLGLHGMSKDAWKRFGDEGYKHYQVVECGFKYNMMDIQAAIGVEQMRKVEGNWERRQQIWNQYQEAFRGLPLGLPAPVEPDTRHAYHLYTLLIDPNRCGLQRDHFLEAMGRLNIGLGVHYLSLAEHPYYQQTFGWNAADYPYAQRIGQQTVSLPLSSAMTAQDVSDVIEAVQSVLANAV